MWKSGLFTSGSCPTTSPTPDLSTREVLLTDVLLPLTLVQDLPDALKAISLGALYGSPVMRQFDEQYYATYF